MFWLTIRQHRIQLVVTAALLAGFGLVLLVHGIGTADAAAGLSGGDLEAVLAERHQVLGLVIGWLPAVPLLVGLFWGAPVLAREFERGTHYLAWTQTVPRGRWLLLKLAWLGLLVTLAGLALGAMVTAWTATFAGTRFASRFGDNAVFASTGVAAGAWWLFAFMVGVAGGAVLRRMLPAMAVTVAVFLLAMVGVFTSRDEYAEPARVVSDEPMAMSTVDLLPAGVAWVDPAGREVEQVDGARCPVPRTYWDCMRDAGYRVVSYVHPPDRYWHFQWTEAGILLCGAVLLAGVAHQRVARRSV
ncbi:ABC transporter permease [Actinophytocola sp.]|uniref:ABC transporter permease n=1 Tax=Actinophytocola sp. TaxID=1872138 RepID=UPI003D6AB71D